MIKTDILLETTMCNILYKNPVSFLLSMWKRWKHTERIFQFLNEESVMQNIFHCKFTFENPIGSKRQSREKRVGSIYFSRLFLSIEYILGFRCITNIDGSREETIQYIVQVIKRECKQIQHFYWSTGLHSLARTYTVIE